MTEITNLKQNKRVFVFIDASNIMYGCTRAGWKMDFEKLMRYLKTRYGADRVLYYAGLDSGNKKQLLFYELLQRFGYELRLVPVKTFIDGSRKGDVDARVAFEGMKYYNEYDKAVFLAGDGDYFWLFEYLLETGKIVRLLGHAKNTARELKQLFSHAFLPLENIRHHVELKK